MPNEPMTEERLVEIRGRAEAATPGPWGLDYKKLYVFSADDVNVCEVRGWGELSHKHGFDKDATLREMQKNAVFIAHAREDIPALLDEVERLSAENEQLKEAAWKVFQAGKKLVDIECEKEMKNVEEFALRYTMEHNKR